MGKGSEAGTTHVADPTLPPISEDDAVDSVIARVSARTQKEAQLEVAFQRGREESRRELRRAEDGGAEARRQLARRVAQLEGLFHLLSAGKWTSFAKIILASVACSGIVGGAILGIQLSLGAEALVTVLVSSVMLVAAVLIHRRDVSDARHGAAIKRELEAEEAEHRDVRP